jgi:hypothetical protein
MRGIRSAPFDLSHVVFHRWRSRISPAWCTRVILVGFADEVDANEVDVNKYVARVSWRVDLPDSP